MNEPNTLRRSCAALILLGAVAFHGRAHALTFDREVPNLEGIAREATLGFRGVVYRIETGQATDGEAHVPYTSVTFFVTEAYRGCEPGQEIVLRQLGGPVVDKPNIDFIVPGLAEFGPGEEVVVFANDRVQPFFGSFFGDHGVYRVATDEDGVERVLDANWHPLVRVAGGIDVARARCEARTGDRRNCTLDTKGVKAGVAPGELDTMIRGWIGTKALGQSPQSIAHDRVRFERALVAFARQDVEGLQRILQGGK